MSITPGHVEAQVLAMFQLFGALTDDELCDQLPELHGPTVRSARSRLRKCAKNPDGPLFDSGLKRPSSRGRASIVWELAR